MPNSASSSWGPQTPMEAEAIAALGRHYGLVLTRERCFPYK
jgi:hypothetical protein